MSLIPSWMLIVVWLFGASMVVIGKLSGEVVVSGLIAGLVLIVVLLGFTVTQFAFRSSGGTVSLGPPSLVQMKSLAVDGSGTDVFQWHAGRDLILVGSDVETELGLDPGALNVTADEFLQHMHASDRERFRLLLLSLQENKGGDIQTDFRLRRHDGTYLWYDLHAHAEPSENVRLLRCVGLMRDITSLKRAQERLMHDSVHDSLTGLPNQELFLDRLQGAITRSAEGQASRPTVLIIDIDRFKNVNQSFGLVISDSMLLTLGRRLGRHLNPQDTLARLGGDQFAILLISDSDPHRVATLVERVRRVLRTPMKISTKEIILTASIGIIVHDGTPMTAQEMLRDGEIAMLRAKRGGADRIEIYTGPYGGALTPDVQRREFDRVLVTGRGAAAEGIGLNAGHDLTLNNLPPLVAALPNLMEVSIGHCLTADALIYGMEGAITRYRDACARQPVLDTAGRPGASDQKT